MNKRLFILSFLLPSVLSSCANNAIMDERPFFSFSTIFNITSYNSKKEDILKGEALINKYNKYFDAFTSYENLNNIYTINNTNEEVKLDKELYEALKVANEYYIKTENYFNPYIGELSFAYKEAFTKYEEDKILDFPNEEFIKRCLQNIDEFKLIFNDSDFSIQRKGDAKIDLGAFGKGYALNEVKKLFNENEVLNYFINGGNSSTYFTSKVDGTSFKASIKYLSNTYLEIKDASLGISSIFEQLIEADGKLYSHIVNPFTGKSESIYDFVIIKHEDPILTDVMSTVLMIIEDKTKIEDFSTKFGFDYLIYKNSKEVYSKNIELKKH